MIVLATIRLLEVSRSMSTAELDQPGGIRFRTK